MKCVNCGKELNESAKFCDECGTPVNTSADEPVVETVVEKKEGAQIFRPEGASTESEKTSFTQKLSVLPMKTKLFIGAGAAVIVILLIVFFASLGGTPTGGGNVNNTPYDTPVNDDFGNNEVITAIPTEQITQAPVNVEVVVNRKKLYSSLTGTCEVIDYHVSKSTYGDTMLEVKIKVLEKEDDPWNYFAVPCAAYDANGNLLWDNNADCDGWVLAEVGDTLKGTFTVSAYQGEVAKFEIG